MEHFIINNATIYSFYTEMLLAVLVVTASLKRRERFPLRAAAALMFSTAVWYAVMFRLPFSHFGYDYLRYFLLFLSTLAGIWACFDVSLGSTLFCGTAAYAIQHLVCRSYILLFYITSIRFAHVLGVWTDVPHFIAYWLLLAVLYFVLHRLLGQHLKITRAKFSTKGQMVTVAVLLVVTLFVSATYDLDTENILNNIIFLFCDGLCAALLLIVQLHAYGLSQKELELAEADALYRMELRQMRQTREMMDLIAIKSHDLKHQLIAAGGQLSQPAVEEIARAVSAYDSSVKTGLESLDLVVTQKKMICEREGIQFSCMADGELLSFMSDVQIYSLAGNLLDNAIDAVRDLQEERRYIVFELRRAAGMILLRTENEYERKLRWQDGALLTSKEDERYHGFGMKSIRSTVERYGGCMDLSARDGLFAVSISFAENTADGSA